MAWVDADSEQVVVRIVYDGPPAAGKTTTLQSLAQRFGQGRLHTPEQSAGGRTLFFDWLEYTGGRYEGRPIRCELLSVPGQKSLAARRQALLATADAVVFVGDTSRSGLADSQAQLDELLTLLRKIEGPMVGAVLQANKRDLPDVVPVALLRGQHGLAVIESVASRGEGIREAFVFAVRLALDRVRELHRQGALMVRSKSPDAQTQLLGQLKALPLIDALDEPVRDPFAAEAPREAERVLPGGIRVPDAQIPGGGIWPPINGRVLLQEASAGEVAARETTPGEWIALGNNGWRFHSAPGALFGDAETGRAALIRWAQAHASLSSWLSPHRCVALCEEPGGFRLWQVVRNEPTLYQRVSAAIESNDKRRIGSEVREAIATCIRVAERWAASPWELPCTLETIGLDGSFVSLLPDLAALRATQHVDRFNRLHREIDELVRRSLGDAGRAAAGLLRIEQPRGTQLN
ncbi:MAG: GTPase domain-containing protein [Myxococcaceae bacterium]